MFGRGVVLTVVIALVGCLPTDEAEALGSVSFSLGPTWLTANGLDSRLVSGGWSIRIDRALLSLDTMTIGKIGDDERCSYRGRGAVSNVVFDARFGSTQTFNGILPAECPDVGIILAPPRAETVVGEGANVDDLERLGNAHALVEATASDGEHVQRVSLVFEPTRTSTRFGGCAVGTTRGVRVVAEERQEVTVSFGAEALFQDMVGNASSFEFYPFVTADQEGNRDGVTTMVELDAMPLRSFSSGSTYLLPEGNVPGATFGDYVRRLFRTTFRYRSSGSCLGNSPGSNE